ncbi:hypothetical protein C3L33_21420, partial [Rhododendron williamsianum]
SHFCFFCAQHAEESYAHPRICLFHVLFKAAALAFYILSALFVNSFVIIFVITVLLAALDFWVVKNAAAWLVLGIFSLIRFQADYLLVIGVCLTLSIANIVGFTKCRKGVQPLSFNLCNSVAFLYCLPDCHLFLEKTFSFYLGIHYFVSAYAYVVSFIGNFLPLTFGVSSDAKKQIQAFASQTIASQFTSRLQSAFSV